MIWKNICSYILAGILIFGTNINSLAAENNFELVYDREAAYEIVIPSDCSIDISTGTGTFFVEISGANLADGTVVSISAFSENYDDGWYLVNQQKPDDKIEYSLSSGEDKQSLVSGGEIFSSSEESVVPLFISLNEVKVGVFTDTITFVSEVVPETIEFILYGNYQKESLCFNLEAEIGMTWAEWIDSDYHETLVSAGFILKYGDTVISAYPTPTPYAFFGVLLDDTLRNTIVPTDIIIDGAEYYIESAPIA